jgi:fructose-1,6-bisphosphatase/inositol monophosphatase family enzyme
VTVSSTVLDTETQAFFEALMERCAVVARRYIRMARMGALESEDKGGARLDGNPVTRADKEIEELIRQSVFARYSGIEFFGEEGGVQRSTAGGAPALLRLIADPLDGTAHFLGGRTHWVVCNFALQERRQEEWHTVLSGAYAPEKDLAALADRHGTKLRSRSVTGDDRFYPVDSLRASLPAAAMVVNGGVVGVHLDLRLMDKDREQAEMMLELREMGCNVRNAGGFAATALELLPVRREKFAFISGNPAGEWDWRAPEYFLRQAGYATGMMHFSGIGAKGGDYPVFIAAGTPQLFAHLERILQQKLT